MSEFTKGPWKVGVDEDGTYAVIKGCSFITYAFPTDLGFEGGDTKANAHLIAASPELYEQLNNIVNAIFRGESGANYLDEAQEALAKARGEAI